MNASRVFGIRRRARTINDSESDGRDLVGWRLVPKPCVVEIAALKHSSDDSDKVQPSTSEGGSWLYDLTTILAFTWIGLPVC